jgi:hypothetical protein
MSCPSARGLARRGEDVDARAIAYPSLGGDHRVKDKSAVTRHRIFGMPFSSVYPMYVQKAERKKRT